MSKAKPHRHLFLFFGLIYALSVPFWLISFLTKNTSLPLDIPIGDVAAAFAPLVAALLLTRHYEGAAAAWTLFKRVWDVRKLSWKAAVFIVGVPALLYAAAYASFVALGYSVAGGFGVSLFGATLLMIFFYLGAIGEEAGYSAYATDPLIKRYGVLTSSLIIGMPWAVWHMPSMLTQGRTLEWIVWGIIGTVAVRYLYVWLYKWTNSCVSAVVAMHVIFNFGRVVFPHSANSSPLVEHEAVYYSLFVLAAVLVGVATWLTKRSRMARSLA